MAKAEAPKLYLFISHREINIGSTTGRSILFEKGVPTHVPREMHGEVMEKGCLPCDTEGKIVDDIAEVSVPQVGKILLAPEDPAEREEKIVEVIHALVERNARGDFSGGGVPHDAAVTAALGWKVDAVEIRKIWTRIKPEIIAKKAGGK